MILPGKTVTLSVTLAKPGSYEHLCTVGGLAGRRLRP